MRNAMTAVFVSCHRLLRSGFSAAEARDAEVETPQVESAGGWGGGSRAGLAVAALRTGYDSGRTTDAARCVPQWG